jgi:hypothetical protein
VALADIYVRLLLEFTCIYLSEEERRRNELLNKRFIYSQSAIPCPTSAEEGVGEGKCKEEQLVYFLTRDSVSDGRCRSEEEGKFK